MPIPEFYCPIPYAIQPAWKEVDALSREWLKRQFGSRAEERHARGSMGYLAALAAPRAATERLQLYADFLMWLAVFDDLVVEEGELAANPGELAARLRVLIRVIEAPESGPFEDLVALALRDLRLRVGLYATAGQLTRWSGAIRGYLFDQVYKAHLNRVRSVPGIDEYTLLRLYDTSMGACTALLDIVSGYEVPPAAWESPAVRALTEMTCLLVGWDNDIISYQKENGRTGGEQNLIDVLAAQHRCPVPDVLPLALGLRDRVMHRFTILGERVKHAGGESLQRYVDDLGSWILANLEWGLRSDRYRLIDGSATAFAATLPENHRVTVPSQAISSAPLSIPAIAWWWDADL